MDGYKLINDINQIKEITKQKHSFHDWRISYFDIKDDFISITVEENMGTDNNAGAESATYKICNYTDLEVSLDCILIPFVYDVYFEDENTIVFDLLNGCVTLKYGDIEFQYKEV